MNKTAIEWLVSELFKPVDSLEPENVTQIIEQAKEMERQQIIMAYETGDKYKFEIPGEQYYTQTYKTKIA
jgi:hypothetical protein